MKVKCEIVMDLDTGEFELKVHNLTSPNEPMDYTRIREIVNRVLISWDASQTTAES